MTTGKRKRATWPRWTTSSPELSGTASTNSATSTRRPAGTPRIPPGWGPYSCSWSKIPKQSWLSRARRGKNESYIYIGYASFVHFGSTRRQTHDSPNKLSSRKTIFLRTKKMDGNVIKNGRNRRLSFLLFIVIFIGKCSWTTSYI